MIKTGGSGTKVHPGSLVEGMRAGAAGDTGLLIRLGVSGHILDGPGGVSQEDGRDGVEDLVVGAVLQLLLLGSELLLDKLVLHGLGFDRSWEGKDLVQLGSGQAAVVSVIAG